MAMTIKFIDGAYAGVVCNHCGCDAPDRKAIEEACGLSKLGWKVAGGVHLCPDHVDEAVVATSPIYETSPETND
jgi:hypothetical protein